MVESRPASAEDAASILGLGRSPGEGNGNPLQYSCLENPMDRGAWRDTVHRAIRVGHTTKRLSNNSSSAWSTQLCSGLFSPSGLSSPRALICSEPTGDHLAAAPKATSAGAWVLSFLHGPLQSQRSSYGVLYFPDSAVRKKDHGFRAAINTLAAFMLRECFAAQLFSHHTSWLLGPSRSPSVLGSEFAPQGQHDCLPAWPAVWGQLQCRLLAVIYQPFGKCG